MESRSLVWSLDGDRVLAPDEITDFENLYDQMSYLVSKMKYAVEDLSKLKLRVIIEVLSSTFCCWVDKVLIVLRSSLR